ncbi:MAG: hypothetical protein EB127_24405, partial [Alphaproteobacteria bacterium]|nr:hypothetical protein [Alphaproteobacteria bacterium]
FICNYWNSLPEKIAFIHGHEYSTHQCIPIFKAIELFKGKEFHGLNGPRIVAYYYFFEDVPNLWFNNPLNVWSHIGLNRFFCMPKQFVFQGATQTILSKRLIKFYPKQFYEDILTRIMSASEEEAWYIGLFLELVWHTLFQQSAINFELIDMEINNHCIQNKTTIALLGKNRVWCSRFQNVIVFKECEDHNEWSKSCREILFSKDLWNNNIIV